MSETIKPAAAPREKTGAPGSDRMRMAADTPPGAAAETKGEPQDPARILGDVARRIVEQGQAAMQLGIGAMANAQAPVAENGYQQGRRGVAIAMQVTDAYRDAIERSSGDLQTLTTCTLQLMRGTQRFQYAWLEEFQRTLERLGEKPQRFAACTSPVEMAQLQRDMYGDLMSSMVASAETLLRVMNEVSQDALRPLRQPLTPLRS
ncbi:MAG TPA: phasin family protein [Rhodopila sp.]|nr:phasin family protein [Rhodopila sp.]